VGPVRNLLEQCCQKLCFSNKFASLNPGGVGQKERTWLGHVLSAVNELASFDLEGDDPIAMSVAYDGADRPQHLRAVHLENSLSAMRLPKRPRYSLTLWTCIT